MKKIIIVLAIAVAAQAQWVKQGTIIADSVKWGRVASNSDLLFRGSTFFYDSAGTWVRLDNTADSCSLPVRLEAAGAQGIWFNAVEAQVRTSASNTDSAAIKFAIETRYCSQMMSATDTSCVTKQKATEGAGVWIKKGRKRGDGNNNVVTDSLTTLQPLVANVEEGQELGFYVTGSQIRFCPDHLSGNGTGDSTFIRRIILRVR